MKELGYCSISLVIWSFIVPACIDFQLSLTSNSIKNPIIIFILIYKGFLFIWNEIRPGGT